MGYALQADTPNQAIYPLLLTNLAGTLYGCSTTGDLYHFTGSAWVQDVVGAFAGSPAYKLTVSNGKIYVVTSDFLFFGNQALYVWNGTNAWTSLGVNDAYSSYTSVTDICDHAGELYILLGQYQGTNVCFLVKWTGAAFANVSGANWTKLDGSFYANMISFSGSLYLISANGTLYLNGTPPVAKTGSGQSANSNIPLYAFGYVFGGLLYFAIGQAGGAGGGSLYVWDGVSAWTTLVTYSASLAFSGIASYAGSLFMTRTASAFKYDGASSIAQVATATGYTLYSIIAVGSQTFAVGFNGSVTRLYELVPAAAGSGMFMPIQIPGICS